MTEGEERTPLEVDVRRGSPTPEDLAALIAVVSEAYEQESATASAPDAETDVWGRAARAIRPPLRRDVPFGRFVG